MDNAAPLTWRERLSPAQARRLEELRRIAPNIVAAAEHPLMGYVMREGGNVASTLRNPANKNITVLRWMLRNRVKGIAPQVRLADVSFRELMAVEVVRRIILVNPPKRLDWIGVYLIFAVNSYYLAMLVSPVGWVAIAAALAVLCKVVHRSFTSIEIIASGAMSDMLALEPPGGFAGTRGDSARTLGKIMIAVGAGVIAMFIILAALPFKMGVETTVAIMLLGAAVSWGWRMQVGRNLAREFEEQAKVGARRLERMVRAECGDVESREEGE